MRILRFRTITMLLAFCFLQAVFLSKVLAFEVLTMCDSITQGFQRTAQGVIYGVPSPVNGAANFGSYHPNLNSLLDANIEPSTLYNWGVAGENSIGAVGRIGPVLDTRAANYILIMCGANDLYQGVSNTANRANLSSMIDQARARNTIPIIAEITPNNTFNSIIATYYNPLIQNLAEEKEVTIALMHQQMNAGWNAVPYHSGDGLHLSHAGYLKMSSIWYEAILLSTIPPSTTSIAPILQLLLLDED